ncbi:MAG: AAA family ATPase [Muribaculaceae bacterium]|nr:AAA family ATPase [Muribaculaceae bacterium]
MNYPQPIKKRELNNPRLGIKSSLPYPRKMIALLYLIYLNANKQASVKYLVTNQNDKSKATLASELASNIVYSIGETEDYLDTILANPLVESQIEPLQVALQLFFRLAKINFTTPGQSERTGRVRFPKTLEFSSNMDIIDLFLSRYNEEERTHFLKSWLNEDDDQIISPLMKKLLVTFIEPTIFRITENDGEILDFDLFGMYQSLLNKGMNNVDYKGSVELKGTSRVLDSFLRNGLHPFISLNRGTAEIISDCRDEFKEYAKRVGTSLSIAPQLDDYPFQSNQEQSNAKNEYPTLEYNLQQIFFGAPGVGKSHHLKSVFQNDTDTIRITFHPETDYASFVGCYKPQSDDSGDIIYKFQGQAFAEAYIEAWVRYTSDYGKRKDFFLIIEEINRGNCAQIFGDIFQLLDRNQQGFSDYSVHPDKDLALYLDESFSEKGVQDKLNSIKSGLGNGDTMILPPNLHILATMNTSDQSLFPIDSAFKRRWDWVYMPIETKPMDDKGEIITRRIITEENSYDWGEFLDNVNQRIFKTTESEDKQLGFWFVKPKSGNTTISAEDFVSKVIFFLWNDIYKDFGDDAYSIFNFAPDGNPESKEKERHSFKDFSSGFKKVNVALVDAFIKSLSVQPITITPEINSTVTNAD